MRKGLLLMAAVLAAGTLSAKNQQIDDFYTLGLSPDGSYIHGSDGVFFLIRNIKTDQEWNYSSDNDAGNGNCWTADGMMVGNLDDFTPAIWKDGKWTPLPVDASVTHILRGVTPDGKYICGTMGMPKPSGDVEDYLMSAPCIWERQDDGSYGNPIPLPYPETDITGRVPQYVTANNISDDGNTIIGQVVDGNGFFIYPIAFFKNEDGSWTFQNVQPDVINPQNVTFPAYPGSGPIMPMAESYLSPEEMADYQAAVEEWHDQGSDYASEPDPYDFLSGENLEAYEKALSEYYSLQSKWEPAFIAWWKSYNRLMETGHTFEFNDLFLSPDGRFYGTSAQIAIPNEDEGRVEVFSKKAPASERDRVLPHDGNGTKKYIPYVFNLNDDTYKAYDTEFINGVELYSVLSDGTVVGVNEPTPYPQTYLFLKGEANPTGLKDYVEGISKETADWMSTHMTHDIEVYDPENDNFQLEENVMITGIPFVTPDLNTIVTTAYAIWTDQGSAYLTYVLTPKDPSSVAALPAAQQLNLTVSKDGIVTLNKSADVEVFALTGSKVFSAENVTEARPSLEKGIYLVKATTEDGETLTRKVAL